MRGIGLIFTSNGAYFQFDRRVEGFGATVQNALVNLGTRSRSDPCYPERGTRLGEAGARGEMISPALAQQAADFAALHTTAFSRASGGDPLQRLTLKVVSLQDSRLTMRIAAEGANGETIGNLVSL